MHLNFDWIQDLGAFPLNISVAIGVVATTISACLRILFSAHLSIKPRQPFLYFINRRSLVHGSRKSATHGNPVFFFRRRPISCCEWGGLVVKITSISLKAIISLAFFTAIGIQAKKASIIIFLLPNWPSFAFSCPGSYVVKTLVPDGIESSRSASRRE